MGYLLFPVIAGKFLYLFNKLTDIAELAAGCRYPDCRHDHEPGCAVRAAVEAGILPEKRLESYLRLTKELEFYTEKNEIGLKRIEKKKYKWIGKAAKEFQKDKRY